MPFILLLLLAVAPVQAQELAGGVLKSDPNGVTPLSAVFVLKNTNTAPLTVRVKGKNPVLDIAHTYPAGYGAEFAIHGLYADHSNTVEVEQEGSKRAFRVVTKPFHEKLAIKTQVLLDQLEAPDPFNQDLYFINVLSQRALLGFDRAGEIRYMLRKEIYNFIRLSFENGRLLVHNAEKNGDYVELDLLGQEFRRFNQDKLHHDIAPIGQNFLLPSLSQWGWEDAVSEYGPDGSLLAKKHLGDALRKAASPRDKPLLNQMIFDDKNIALRDGAQIRVDWAHVNGFVYDPAKDLLILSARHQGLIGLHWKTWELIWWMADSAMVVDPGFGYGRMPRGTRTLLEIPSLQKYRLALPPLQGPRNQHAPLLKANGNIIMFDNIGETRKDPQGSRAVEYQIKGNKAVQVREFRHPRKFHSRLSSDIDLTGPNRENWLILWAETYPNHLSEIGPDNTILYDLSFQTKQLFFRTEKMPLYPYADTRRKYSIDQNEALGI